jgi:hypothetical protein
MANSCAARSRQVVSGRVCRAAEGWPSRSCTRSSRAGARPTRGPAASGRIWGSGTVRVMARFPWKGGAYRRQVSRSARSEEASRPNRSL